MSNQFYQMYLDELGTIRECTKEEIKALLKSLPNEDAINRLAEGSLAYVVREAQKYAGKDVEVSDLVQEGNMALWLVLKNYKFNSELGISEEDYFESIREKAVNMAMQNITDDQQQNEKTAEKLAASVNVLNVVMTKLAEELGRQATLSEIAQKMQMTEDEVQAVMKEAINAVAVDRSEAAQKEDESLEQQ